MLVSDNFSCLEFYEVFLINKNYNFGWTRNSTQRIASQRQALDFRATNPVPSRILCMKSTHYNSFTLWNAIAISNIFKCIILAGLHPDILLAHFFC